jgi:PTS system maltose and glucose-specific IIC component
MHVWEFFQSLGKTFMLPVSLLAFMGLLLGLGSSLSSRAMIEAISGLGHPAVQLGAQFLVRIGGIAFTYLPLMFAMALPAGLVRVEKGVAAFSGAVGFIVLHVVINFYLSANGQLAQDDSMRTAGQTVVLGIQTIEMGVLGGIVVGLIVYQLHRRYYTMQLRDSFAFFSGVRFVPIVTTLTLALIGLIVPLIWPLFAVVITSIGRAVQQAGIFGPFLFGAGERLLLPFGLHHILVSLIRFTEAGGSAIINGEEVFGALNIFYGELQHGVPISATATAFLSQGKMPTFMFGLPAAALAMYHTAVPEKRAGIKGLLLSGIMASFVTGITEPIEFLFLFCSPLLWIFHVFMTGAGFMVMHVLGVMIGNTDGGVLDFIIFGLMQGEYTRWWIVLLVGAVWFAAYFFTFKFVIERFDVKTPGRVDALDAQTKTAGEAIVHDVMDYDAFSMLAALGGKRNIVSLDNCITRLRLVVSDGTKVDDAKLKALGALGVVHLDAENVQVIIGTKVTALRAALDAIL